MQIQVNGDTIDVADDMTLGALLAQMDLGERRVAIELNLEIIPRSQHAETQLSANDRVEIVHAIGGG